MAIPVEHIPRAVRNRLNQVFQIIVQVIQNPAQVMGDPCAFELAVKRIVADSDNFRPLRDKFVNTDFEHERQKLAIHLMCTRYGYRKHQDIPSQLVAHLEKQNGRGTLNVLIWLSRGPTGAREAIADWGAALTEADDQISVFREWSPEFAQLLHFIAEYAEKGLVPELPVRAK